MRKQGYSHPQLSSGYACRDKRWSGLIPSNKIESYHLLSSVALGSAQWERPHPKDTHTVTASIVWAEHLGGKSNVSASDRQCVCTCKRGSVGWEPGRAQDQCAKGEEPSPPHRPLHTLDWGSDCRHNLETQGWTPLGMQPQARDKGESATKAEFVRVTSFIKWISKTH